ncbi:ABC transporter permease subunit [Salibacterium halotolerans]|uniref:ABC-2 family transporter protein n=1 Tax=Salibacterium halotolerans TaxID=1884432 RepID=A0A1I5Y7F1_9BACI|nr:ABC transporter permease subunit [Salibacterium halotolerans]SFQ40128.1 hypothetical protein SAMN05518683_13711 [Salibacterium halotolerans]
MILKQELLKIVKTPVIPALLAFFMLINLIIIISDYHQKDEMKVLTNMVEKYGYHIDEEMLSSMEDDYKENVTWMNQVVQVNDKTYEHPSALLSNDSISLQERLNDQKLRKLQKFSVMEQYYRTSRQVDDIYQNIQVSKQAEKLINMYNLQGEAAETVRNGYQKVKERLAEIIDNGEHRNLFFKGTAYEKHSFLFGSIARALIFELMGLVVLITAFAVNFEFEQKTHLLTYTSRTGRNLVWHKAAAAAVSTLAVIAVLTGFTLLCYFLIYDYSGLWHVPISSYFNTELKFPYISWWNVSFIQYLGLFIVCLTLTQLLFMAISMILSIFIKNSYIVFLVFSIIFGIGLLVPTMMPLNQNVMFAVHFTPFSLILNPHTWFMGNGALTFFRYYEAATIGGWMVLLAILVSVSVRFFKKQPLS